MSRARPKSKKILKVAGVFLAVIIVVVLAAFINTEISNNKTRDRIAAQYNLVRLPASLRLHYKQFDGRPYFNDSPGLMVEWVYSYEPVSSSLTFQTIRDELTKSLQTAGYTISKDANPDPAANLGNLDAQNQKLHLSFSIDGDGTPTSKVQLVSVEAYE